MTSDEQRVVDCETRLTAALQYLSSLRRAALICGDYDRGRFANAVKAYRLAEREANEARRQLTKKGVPVTTIEQDKAHENEPFEPTPNHLFVQWLYQTGRINDN